MKKEIHVVTQNEAAGAQSVISSLIKHNSNAKGVFLYNKNNAYCGDQYVNILKSKPDGFLSHIYIFFMYYLFIIKDKPEVVFLHTHNAMVLCFLTKFFVKKVVVVHHGMPSKYSKVIRSAIDFLTLKGFFDKVICVSEDSKSELNYSSIVMDSVVVINNAISIPAFFEKCALLDSFLCDSSVFLFTTGRLHFKKNHKFLFDLMNILPDNFKLVIAGDGDLRTDYQTYINESNSSSRIYLSGNLSPEQVHFYLNKCDLFLFPSLQESFGLSPLEAVYHKRNVICNDLVPLRNVLKSSACFIPAESNELITWRDQVILLSSKVNNNVTGLDCYFDDLVMVSKYSEI